MEKLAAEQTVVVKDEIETQRHKCLLKNKNSDGHPCVVLENVSVKNEVLESGSEGLLSVEHPVKKERDNCGTDSWFDSEVFENVTTQYKCEKESEDDVGIKYSQDETVSKVVDNTIIPNIASNPRMSETNDVLCNPQISTKTDLPNIKCLKTPTIHLLQSTRIQPCILRNSPKIDAGTVEENIKCEQTLLEDSNELNNCSEIRVNELPFKCSEIPCQKSFQRKCDLVEHEKIHFGERPYQCPELSCLKSFTQKSSLNTHQKLHSREKPHKCSFCMESFVYSSQLKLHEKYHNGETPYKCGFCWKAFRSSTNLKEHERIHSNGERPYQCPELSCLKSFSRKKALICHRKMHSGEKPHTCSFCIKSFLQSSELKLHERYHIGETTYKCSFCSKSFPTSGHLKLHGRIHTRERPNKCSFCSKLFTCETSLRKHELIHTEDRPHKCTNCEKAFTTKQHLTLHLQCVHEEEFILS